MDEEIDFVKFVGNKIAELKEAGKVLDVGIFSKDDYDDVDADDVDYDDGDAETHAEDAEF